MHPRNRLALARSPSTARLPPSLLASSTEEREPPRVAPHSLSPRPAFASLRKRSGERHPSTPSQSIPHLAEANGNPTPRACSTPVGARPARDISSRCRASVRARARDDVERVATPPAQQTSRPEYPYLVEAPAWASLQHEVTRGTRSYNLSTSSRDQALAFRVAATVEWESSGVVPQSDSAGRRRPDEDLANGERRPAAPLPRCWKLKAMAGAEPFDYLLIAKRCRARGALLLL
jgi:hypothetical protein